MRSASVAEKIELGEVGTLFLPSCRTVQEIHHLVGLTMCNNMATLIVAILFSLNNLVKINVHS